MKIRLKPNANVERLRDALRTGGAAAVLRVAREEGETAPSEQERKRWAESNRRAAAKKSGPSWTKRSHGAGPKVSQCVGKARYRDAEEAKRHKVKAEAARKVRLRIYGPCGVCAGFHLTRRTGP